MKNTGIHHISVLSSDVEKAYDFYHNILGLKLIIKTVNQDDSRMYHLFFGDENGRQGTEFTVFEMKRTKPYTFGTNAIERTMFLVPSEEALSYWEKRFDTLEVCHYNIEDYGNRKILRFEDNDGQRLGLVYHSGIDLNDFQPYVHPGVDEKYAILALGEVHLRARYLEPTKRQLENFFDFEEVEKISAFGKEVTIFRHDNVFKHEVHVIEDKDAPDQRLGVGDIHYVAFGVETKDDLENLQLQLDDLNIPSSGIKNRDFMFSSYFRDPTNNVFEVATPITKKRETFPKQNQEFGEIPLFLPDFLADKRAEIEESLKK